MYRKQAAKNLQASEGEVGFKNMQVLGMKTNWHHDEALKLYNELIDAGVAREQARGILPQNLMTKFYMTGNLRNWVHFTKLRIDKHAQGEVQEVGQQVYKILLDKFPESTKALMENK